MRILEYIITPIYRQPIFFLTTFVILSRTAIANLFNIANGLPWEQVPYHFADICLCAIFAYIGSLCIRQNWMKYILYLINAILILVIYFLKFNFNYDLSPLTIRLVFETNTNEAVGFLNTFATSIETLRAYFIAIFYLIIVITLEFCFPIAYLHNILRKNCILRGGVYIILFGGIIWGAFSYFHLFKCESIIETQYWNGNPYISSHNDISKIIYSVYEIHLDGVETNKQVDITLNVSEEYVTCSFDDKVAVIYVLGESYIKHHSQLYGYPLATTPHMVNEYQNGNLFFFTNVITPYNYTINALKNIFSCNDINRGEWWSDYPQFPYLFKLAGYDVTYFDNQFTYIDEGKSDYSLQGLLFNDRLLNTCYSCVNNTCYKYDGQLIADFLVQIATDKTKSFKILHLQGQHIAPQDRYPVDMFSCFNADSLNFRSEPWLNKEKKEYIAAYDNATLYNDYVMGLLFDYFRNKNAVILYHSDHGEEAYDYRDMCGRKFVEDLRGKDFRRCQYDVPFIIWCSDIYMRNHRDVLENIKASLNKPFMIDNICQVLFHIGGVNTSFYHKERDILSEDFVSIDRYVDVVGNKYVYNYDEITR